MPNNTKNIIRFGGDRSRLEEMKERLRSQDGEQAIDFNRIVEMPKTVADAEESTTTEMGLALLTDDVHKLRIFSTYPFIQKENPKSLDEVREVIDRVYPDAREKAQLVLENKTRYGFNTWLDWARHYWGTKWNAYSIGDWTEGSVRDWSADEEREADGGEKRLHYIQLQFETAWCYPAPIIKALIEMAKESDLTFDHWFSDEGGSHTRFNPLSNEYDDFYEHNVSSEVDWS